MLGALRGGVQSALESLGCGFLNHPSNGELREALQSGQLSRQQFHEQLLRLVYRFLFLFTTEDRNLLFPREVDKTDARRRIYQEGYSVSRLRELAIKRSAYEGEYGDLWELQRLVFQQLSIGNSPLGLPGLGGLFSLEQCPDLQAAELWNGPCCGQSRRLAGSTLTAASPGCATATSTRKSWAVSMRDCSNCIPNWSNRAANGSSAMAAVRQ